MIIDAHVHVLPERMRATRAELARADPWFAACHRGDRAIATVDDLLRAMDASGIDRAVCFGWPFADPPLCAEVNDHLAEVQRRHADRLTCFATVNPGRAGAIDELGRVRELGLRGAGELNSDAQGFDLDSPQVDELAAASAELGMPWTLHCSEPVGHSYAGKGTATPDRVARFAMRNPKLTLVCAHLGGGLPFYAHMPEVRDLCRRLWFDTAAGPLLYSPSAYRAVVDLCGADRLLFGSDHPLLRAGRYVEAFATAGLTDAERRAVMGESAAALLGL